VLHEVRLASLEVRTLKVRAASPEVRTPTVRMVPSLKMKAFTLLAIASATLSGCGGHRGEFALENHVQRTFGNRTFRDAGSTSSDVLRTSSDRPHFKR